MKESKLLPGIFAKGFGLWIEKDRALVIADLHLGIEGEFNKRGMLLPRFNFKAIKNHLEKEVFQDIGPELIVINGDLKHEFGSVSEQEWSEVIDLLRFLQQKAKRLVLVRGNHDTILGPIAKWESLKIEKQGLFLEKSLTFVCHGEKIPKGLDYQKASTVVIGHEHPAIRIRDQGKEERFKCFLVGKFGKKNLVALPSLNQAAMGSDPREEKALSPFLKQDISKFRVFAVEDKIYDFGKLGKLD